MSGWDGYKEVRDRDQILTGNKLHLLYNKFQRLTVRIDCRSATHHYS